MRINYKSDFDMLLGVRDCKGDVVPFPDCDWEVRFYAASKANVYVASRKGEVYTNCFAEGDKIHFVFDNHGLGKGQLHWEPHFELPNDIYPDGIQDLYRPQPLDVELVDGAGDCGDMAVVEAMLPYIKGDKGDKGDRGERGPEGPQGPQGERGAAFTYEDFTPEQIGELQRPATEAAESVKALEHSVETAETDRRAAEQRRIDEERVRNNQESIRQTQETFRVNQERNREKAEDSREAAEAKRAEDFATWQGEIDSKADRSELSNVLARESSMEAEDVYRPEMKVFDDEWRAAGGTVIVSGVTYGCNGTNNLTYDEAVEIKQLYSKRKGWDYSRMFFASSVRALLPVWIPNGTAVDMLGMFQSSHQLTKIVFQSNVSPCVVKVKNLFATFHTCGKLKEIDTILDVSDASQVDAIANFHSSSSLEEIRIRGLKTNIYFNFSPKLSLTSFQYLVDNAANTKAITITVHPDVYAKLTDESNTEWHALLAQAAEKNITFATV